ncbi:unnamed protein product [Caenorhabditis angaria]|uniref:UBR-type domain-containing protein n=1 Tax=Caenorhabditis angaria TaxID=860376 RepID=A0A9P1I3G5_9PELO|nr:unnamed protein product [Caenorhabditis angaria]
MDENPRQLALGLAKFLVEKPDEPLSGEQIGAIIYRLRVVDNYGVSDVNRICDAFKIIIKRVVNIPSLTFCSDYWLLMVTAIIEGSIESEWKNIVEETDVLELAKPYLNEIEEFGASRQILKTTEQINKNIEYIVLESGLIRRAFESFWETNLENVIDVVYNEKWEELDIQSNECSTSQAFRFINMKIFENFRNLKDHTELAKQLYFAALTRVIIRVSQIEEIGEEDNSECVAAFTVFKKLVKLLWSDLCDNSEIRKYSLVAFEKLLNVSLPCGFILRSIKEIENTCGWLKIPTAEICESLDFPLWSCYFTLTFKLFEFKINMPFEMASNHLKIPSTVTAANLASPEDFDSDNWLETMCEKIPAMLDEQTKEEKNIRDKIDRTRDALNFILDVLLKSTTKDEAIEMMRKTYSELISAREPETAARVKNVYKSFVDRKMIKDEDQLKLAHEVIKKEAIHEIKAIVSCIPEDSRILEDVAKVYFEQIIEDLTNEEGEKSEEIAKKLENAEECISLLVRYISQQDTIKIVKLLINVIQNEKNKHIEFAMTLLSRIVDSSCPTEFAHREKVGWFLDFNSLEISNETWNAVLSKIAEFNKKEVEKRFISGLTVLSVKQLTDEELCFDELMYVLRRVGYQRTELGKQCMKKFYNNSEEIGKAIEKFTSHQHILNLSNRFIKLLSESISNNGIEWQEHAHSLELIISFLKESDVSSDPTIISSLIAMTNVMTSWQLLITIALPFESVLHEESYCLSRIWKSTIFESLSKQEMDMLDSLLISKVDEHSEKYSREPWKNAQENAGSSKRQWTKRAPTIKTKQGDKVPKRTRQEIQLISLFTDICMHLLSCSDSLTDKDEELFGWLIGVTCSCSNGDGLYTEELILASRKLLFEKFGEIEVGKLQRMHVMYYLMMGSTIKSDSENIFLNEYFIALYILTLRKFLQNEVANIEDGEELNKYMGNLEYWMNECSNTEKRSCAFTKTFVKQFGDLLREARGFKASCFLDKTIGKILENIEQLPGWLENSKCAITSFSAFKSIFTAYIESSDKFIDFEPKIQKALLNSVEIVLSERAVENILKESKYNIQFSENRNLSSLNIREMEKDEKVDEIIRDSLKIFGLYGGFEVQKKVVERISKLIPNLLKSISEQEGILNGKIRKSNEDKSLAFNVMFVTEMIEYLNSITKTIFPDISPAEEHFEKIFMINDDEIENRHKKMDKIEKLKEVQEESESEKKWKECSFKTTGNSFILQHWYNCYTCGMTDSKGVCSVCAVNCHRGHSLSYSKKGSFFCDCGENNCAALANPRHIPNIQNVIRGHVSSNNDDSKNTTYSQRNSVYKLRMEEFEESEVVGMKSVLEKMSEVVQNCKEDMEKVINSIKEANENGLNVAKKRESILKSIENVHKVEVTSDESFLEELDWIDERSCFLPARNRETEPGRAGFPNWSNKMRDLANVMKLENGKEVWLVIPESTQATLHLFHMDTRFDLKTGFSNVRQETEQLPFVGRSLSISGNRVAVWGIADVFCMRFSPSGDVIDRAHIRLTEMANISNNYNNPVVKAIWCKETDRQILVVGTIQYVRVYDLTLDLEKCIEEMVLPTGNVEDIAMITLPEKRGIKLLVLGSTGYLYSNDITSTIADNNSIFLTNCLNTPIISQSGAGNGFSLHYSPTFELLFVSFEKGTFFTRISTEEEQTLNWKRLNLNTPVVCWKEAAGIISCLSNTQTSTLYHIRVGFSEVSVQKVVSKRMIMSQFLAVSSKNDGIFSFVLHNDQPTIQVFKTCWEHVSDLWIEDIPTEQVLFQIASKSKPMEITPKEDLVLLNEGCEVIENVEWTSEDLSRIYESSDLKLRLSIDTTCPLRSMQLASFRLSGKIGNSRMIVRGLRLDVGPTGPAAVIVNGNRFDTSVDIQRTVDLRFTREQSLQMDHREIEIICEAKRGDKITIHSLKLFGCDRDLMEEIKPIYKNQPVYTLPNRFVGATFEMLFNLLPVSKKENDQWLNKLSEKHLSRKISHPNVCLIATRLLRKLNKLEMFEIIDASYIEEWKSLKEWKLEDGMIEIRRKYVDQLIRRLETVSTRWTVFEKLLRKAFPNIIDFLSLLRDEMVLMPLSTCQYMAQGMFSIIFGFLAEYAPESEAITKFFLDLYTDSKTCHLTSDMRSAVQIAMYNYGMTGREDRNSARRMIEEENQNLYWKMKVFGSAPFYGQCKIHLNAEKLEDIRWLCGSVDASKHLEKPAHDKEFEWLDALVKATIDKLFQEGSINSMPNNLQAMTDSPSYGLTMIAISFFGQYYTNRVRVQLDYLIGLMKFEKTEILPMNEKNFKNFAMFRLMEYLLGRYATSDNGKKEAVEEIGIDEKKKRTVVLLQETTKQLLDLGIIEMCYEIIDEVVPYWKKIMANPESPTPNSLIPVDLPHTKKVWLPHVPLVASSANLPNSNPNSENNIKTAEDVYITSVTEVCLRIPALLQKNYTIQFDEKWFRRLCELVCLQESPVYRNSKKMLVAICGGEKLKYRALRDKFRLQEYLDILRKKYSSAKNNCEGHQQLTEIVDILKLLTSLATTRKEMWKEMCEKHILWLLKLACTATDVISLLVLDLIIIGVRDSSAGGNSSIQLADCIIEAENGILLNTIVNRFLFGREENQRWIVHGLLRSIIQLASRQNQVGFIRRLYSEIYPKAKSHGCHAAQITDLLSTYAPRVFNTSELLQMCHSEIRSIEETAKRFDSEGISGLYKQMMELGIGWQAILFSQTPCLICFNRKGGNELMKITTIKRDSRYSTNAMIYKLNTNYEISKIILKLGEVKKTKTIKRVTVYYCPKAVESVVELKLNPTDWRKCAHATVSPNDTQINLSLAVPVITSSLIVEYSELHENQQNNQVQCPRCSIIVRSHSGVCENCGENAYQCIKCRAINYVEKEPFLCQTCGYCKYARIDVLVNARKLPGTQHITCDSERAQCIEEMSKLLIRQETRRSEFSALRAYCDSLYFTARPLAPFIVYAENNQIRDSFRTSLQIETPYTAYHASVNMLQKTANMLNLWHDEMCQDTEQLMSLREELTRYDESNDTPIIFYKPKKYDLSPSNNCFGCLCSRIFHSIALIHATCEDEEAKKQLVKMTSLYQIIGSLSMKFEPLREECESLFVRFIIDNPEATKTMEEMINRGNADIHVFIRSLMTVTDSTWQMKLKYLIRYSMNKNDENVHLQTLMILNKYLEMSLPVRSTVYRKLAKRRNESYTHHNKKQPSDTSNRVVAHNYLVPQRDAVTRWLTTEDEWDTCCLNVPSTSSEKVDEAKFDTNQYKWICECLFSEWSTVRAAANRLLVNLSHQPGHEGVAILIMFEWLEKLPEISINLCDQFMHSAHSIVSASSNIKTRLFVEKFHVWLVRRIHAQCAGIHQKDNDELLRDVSFGLKLRCYVELLCLMFSGSSVENVLLKASADDLLVYLLQSTIYLKRLVIRRTRPIDSSRTALEKLLRRVSNKDGTKLMKACVETLKIMKDTNTLAHLVSVMLEVMDPQKEVDDEFMIEIEKDAAQEDFLQGRMSGNPYKSTDSGMGPLMRDIKNKICRDTEMIALMDDDNGMELLVANNIISLSLSVREVYDKLWKRQNPETNVMNIIYRMRGLMGDATEPFISSFGDVDGESIVDEDESLAKITKTLIEFGGLNRLLELLATSNVNSSGRFLLGQLRRIFERIVRTSTGRQSIVNLNTIPIIVKVIRQCYESGIVANYDESKMTLGVDYYKVIELIVTDINVHPNLKGIGEIDAKWLVEIQIEKVSQLLELMAPNLANVLLGSDDSENVLIERYLKVYDWAYIDSIENVSEREDAMWMAEQLSRATSSVMKSKRGNDFKQKILDSGIIVKTCSFLTEHHPPLYSATESSEWKTFLMKPSLKLMLNLLHGLARNHQASQLAIAASTLPLLHRLEQVASENSIGIMAENVMDALKEDPEVANNILAVRAETKQKKRQLAMAMRNKQLSKMGMQIGKSGEVKVSSRKITNEPTLEETSSNDPFLCCICRESAISPAKQSAVYSFAYQTFGTVSLMVMVHLDCHNNAIRRGGNGRSIDEWNKAMLHNAGVRCNILTPIALINEGNSFEAAMNKLKLDYEHIGINNGPITRQFVFTDMCRLVKKFIQKESFSTHSQGGGRESNLQYFGVLYLLAVSLPEDPSNDLQVSDSRDRLITFLFTEPKLENWQESKQDVLRASLNDARMSNFEMTWNGEVRLILLTWAFIDAYFTKIVPITGDDRITWLRENLREVLTKTSKFVQDFDDDLMKCESIEEFCDVAGVSNQELAQIMDVVPLEENV